MNRKNMIEFKDKIIDYLTLLQLYNNCKIENCEELKLIDKKIKETYNKNQKLTYQYKTYTGIENINYKNYIDDSIIYDDNGLYILNPTYYKKYKMILVDDSDYKVISIGEWNSLSKSLSESTYREYMNRIDKKEIRTEEEETKDYLEEEEKSRRRRSSSSSSRRRSSSSGRRRSSRKR